MSSCSNCFAWIEPGQEAIARAPRQPYIRDDEYELPTIEAGRYSVWCQDCMLRPWTSRLVGQLIDEVRPRNLIERPELKDLGEQFILYVPGEHWQRFGITGDLLETFVGEEELAKYLNYNSIRVPPR